MGWGWPASLWPTLSGGRRAPAECWFVPPPGCPAQTFRCGNGKCLPQNQQCDGKDNCGDGSDEATCNLGEAWGEQEGRKQP